jgi:ABC-type multidrug transport system fused ATPase/permease subunit
MTDITPPQQKHRERIYLTKYILLSRLDKRVLILVFSLLSTCFGILSPYFQKSFIDLLVYHKTYLPNFMSFTSPLYAILLAAICLVTAQGFNQLSQFIGLKESLIMQKKLAHKIYNHMMYLKLDTMTQKPLGETVALYATDVPSSTVYLDQTMPSGASTFFPLLITPFVLVYFFDTPIFLTVSMIVIVSAINTTLAFRQSKFFYLFKQLAGQRLGLVNEWIQNIRTIRILGWTEIFENKIIQKRRVETDNRVRMVTNGQMMNSISTSFTFLLNVGTLGLLVFYYKRTLTPGEIFALLWILGVFLTRPFRQMPWFFTFAFDSATSIKRIEDFLNLENKFHHNYPEVIPKDSETILNIKNLNLEINGSSILSIDSFHAKRGELVIIVGEVGSGKSMLLYSLLGETNCKWSSYQIMTSKKIKDWKEVFSFVPQEGFIVSTTLRDNIHLEYEAPILKDDLILNSLTKSEFKKDFLTLENGLDTEFGERGVNLSGGQRQRINIARADFFQSEILLLDDSFSAIDVETEAILINNLLLKEWKNKTLIMTSHRLSLLPFADRIIFLKNGKVKNQGSYDKLTKEDADFRSFTMQLTENTNPF